MADDFNPYHVWLGIPLKDQPANYYRLLSLDLFETSGDVIDSAADRQMAHLRTFQGGKNGELTQRLLNEVAAARVCLLDPKKRAAYDKQLQSQLAAAAPAVVAVQPTKAPPPLQRAVATPTADRWDELLGNPSALPVQKAVGNSANPLAAPTAKQTSRRQLVSIGIAIGVVLLAGIGFAVYSSLSGKSEGTLVFDWPDRTDVTVAVDGATIEVPATGTWEQNFPAGQHQVVAQRPAFKLSTDVTLAAGQKFNVPPDWIAKATLALNWPVADRTGAVLKVDGRPQFVSQHDPLELPVEPGRHQIQITRGGAAAFVASATVAADQHQIVAITRPPAEAKLVLDWPAEQRGGAELTIDGHAVEASSAEPFELTLKPGQHVVRIARPGFEAFAQNVELSEGTNDPLKPTWTPVMKTPTAPTVVETPVPVEATPQPVKKLPVPATAEQDKIAKQLNDLYKTSQSGPKDPAKAQELYDVAAKDESSPNERYMLLMKGAEIAAAAGDLNLSLQGIDTLDADYDIDALEAKQKLLDKFITAGKPDQVASAIPMAEQLVDQAVAADRFDIAVVLATSASRAVAKSKIATHKEVEERLARRRHDIHLIEPIYTAAKKSHETLEKTPDDAQANLTVGRWLCFYKGDWTTGLSLLAKGSDEKLKALAAQEIKSPTDTDQQVQIADAWWDLAQKEAGIARDSLHLHAGNIYQEAMPNLASALKKAAIEKRLAEIATLTQAVPAAAASTSVSPAQSAAQVKFPLNKWVDVLRFVDTTKNAVKGTWTRSGSEITCDAQDVGSIEVPVIVDGSYEMEVEFTRSAGDSDVNTIFTAGLQQCLVKISGGFGEHSGFDSIDKLGANNSANPTSVRPGKIQNGHRYRLRIVVRMKGTDRASVDVLLDGNQYLPHWEGTTTSLSLYGLWQMPDSRELGLAIYKDRVTYHAVRLKLTSGSASFSASAAGPAAAQATPKSVVSGKPTDTAKFPLNQWVDVLRFVDTTKNAVKGKWSRSESEVSCNAQDVAEIQIPVIVDGSYQLEVEFTRTAGDADVNTVFTVGPRQCMVTLSASGGKNGGLAWVDGRNSQDSHNPTAVSPAALDNGHRYQLLVNVQFARPNRASIDVALDGKRYLPHWQGNTESLDLSQGWFTFPNPRELGLGIYKNRVTFHSVRLKMTARRASVDASAVESAPAQGAPVSVSAVKSTAPTTFAPGKWVDVLKLIDPVRDAVRGNWSRSGAELACEATHTSRIEMPVAVDGEYDFEVEFTRTDGVDSIDTIIPVGSHQCGVKLSGWHGKTSGLAIVDGRQPDEANNPTSTRPGTLENGRRYRLLIQVRRPQPDLASIDVLLDGKPYLPHWQGAPASLGLDVEWSLKHPRRPALGANSVGVVYHAARLRMISGDATDESATASSTVTGSATSSEPPTIVSARWGRRKTWVNVTAVVKEAIAKGEIVYANSDFLKVDPTEGRKKQLQITYKLGETEQAANVNEGGKWSKDDYENLKP